MPALETISAHIGIGSGGVLDLRGCKAFRSLPKSLKMGKGSVIDLRGCEAWDGVTPKGLGMEVGIRTTIRR